MVMPAGAIRDALAPWLDQLVGLDDLAAGSRVVVGCSGGADSLALLALARARGLDVLAVYVDHGLRAGTDHDARVVRAAAAELGADLQPAAWSVFREVVRTRRVQANGIVGMLGMDKSAVSRHLKELRERGLVDAQRDELDARAVWISPTPVALERFAGIVAVEQRRLGAVLAVSFSSGAVVSSLATDASYSSLCPSPDGRYVYALRSRIDEAPTPVRLDTSLEHQSPRRLPTPAPTPELPGTLAELSVPGSDGKPVHAWLCLPPPHTHPAPLMLWIHGGPFSSFNSWSWRWNPWTAVARGYAVLMPDPALSTGYGLDWIQRAWPHRAGLVWQDLEAVLDVALQRPEIDARRTACLGASFGGYMTNWVAGHTDRFDAIVTHAGLWALDQQHTTTDGAQWKTGVFGTPEEHPDWYADNSPHNFIDKITTPMLIVHGNRDYRVPISEALRLWWDLARHHEGDPDSMPHRFLQLTGENHWVLSPGNAEIWYDTVLGFCDQHVRGLPFTPSGLL